MKGGSTVGYQTTQKDSKLPLAGRVTSIIINFIHQEVEQGKVAQLPLPLTNNSK